MASSYAITAGASFQRAGWCCQLEIVMVMLEAVLGLESLF
jgi:hypothetical protein